ncbi:MAG: hypothetical protein K0S80_4251 [Neobacillus sp.]|nr:hypothetical protein [Neobacillus sp.]
MATSLQQQTQDYFNKLAQGINSNYDQSKAAQIAQLQAANKSAIDDVNYKKNQLPGQYYASKNQADVVANQNANKTREMMAANGLSASGENVTANIANNNARLKSLNDLNAQQNQATNDYNHQIDQINDPAKQNALVQQIEAQRASALNQAQTQADQTMYQRNQDSISNQHWQQQFDAEQKQNDFSNSMATKQYNLSKSSSSASQKLAQQQLSFQKSRAKSADEQWQKTYNQTKSTQKAQQAWQKYQFNHMSASEKASFNQSSKQFGETQAWNLYQLKQSLAAQTSQSQAELNAYQDMLGSGFSGGGSSSSGSASYQKNLQAAQKSYNIPQSAVPALNWVIQHESGFNPNAKNKTSSAHGYGQFINSTAASMEKKYGVSYSSPVNQIYLTYRYMVDRYGSPQKAMAFWKSHNWY